MYLKQLLSQLKSGNSTQKVRCGHHYWSTTLASLNVNDATVRATTRNIFLHAETLIIHIGPGIFQHFPGRHKTITLDPCGCHQ